MTSRSKVLCSGGALTAAAGSLLPQMTGDKSCEYVLANSWSQGSQCSREEEFCLFSFVESKASVKVERRVIPGHVLAFHHCDKMPKRNPLRNRIGCFI